MAFPRDVVERLLIACHRRCCICHKPCGNKMEIHHIVPQSEGGKDTEENGIPLCFDCHADAYSYNPLHPKGRRFTQSELRRHKEQWFAICKTPPWQLTLSSFTSISRETLYPGDSIYSPPRFDDPRPEKVILDYIENGGEAPVGLLQISNTRWIGGGAVAVTEEGKRRYRLSQIIADPSPRRISTLNGAACAIAFHAEVKPDISQVSVDEIAVTVSSYCSLPRYEPSYPLPFQQAHVYYIEIDNPAVSNRQKFIAEYAFEEAQRQRLGIVRLEAGKPEFFVVRINARTPGIYLFDLDLIASHTNYQEVVSIVKSEEFLFE